MRFTTIIASAAVAAVLGGAGVSVAGATANPGPSVSETAAATASASTTPSSTAAPKSAAEKKGHKALRRHIRRGAARIIAETIGIDRRALRLELVAGKTIATIATEHGVQPQAVISALESAANARIDAAQAADKITATRAAKLKERLQTAIPKRVNEWHPHAKG